MPLYMESVFDHLTDVEALIAEVPWESRTNARLECFMSDPPGVEYTYGSGNGVRTYVSVPMHPVVRKIQERLNGGDALGFRYNVCFLNRYDDDHRQLGWHSDDFARMDHEHPIAVVSFGEEREIWWRCIGEKGQVPPECRRRLGDGSLFVMPPGFQQTHQHRIPRGDRSMGPRVSLTYRSILP